MVRRTWPLVASLGVTQTVAWASTYYLPAILADPISLTLGIDKRFKWSLFFTIQIAARHAIH
jgi:hypothetical protein